MLTAIPNFVAATQGPIFVGAIPVKAAAFLFLLSVFIGAVLWWTLRERDK